MFKLYNDDWKYLSFKHAQIVIQEMKDSTNKLIPKTNQYFNH